MATLDDLRAIAATLPETIVAEGDRFGLAVPVKGKEKGFVWAWLERVHPKKARVVNNDVMAVVVPNLTAKDIILNAHDPNQIFTEPHYQGYPAVLVRLDRVDLDVLTDLVIEAWRCKAPKALVEAYDVAAVTAPVD
ncbi:MAG: hypothetical protein ACO1SV_18965 [Fimbriimonas sp.]